MSYHEEVLSSIFHKSEGYCHHCGKKLFRNKYGNSQARGGWEVDHSIPVSKGGTDHLNNLLPSCIPCNRTKGNLTTRQYRKTIEQSSEETDSLWAGLIVVGLILGIGWLANRFKQKRTGY